jgi:hypothetical protein
VKFEYICGNEQVVGDSLSITRLITLLYDMSLVSCLGRHLLGIDNPRGLRGTKT